MAAEFVELPLELKPDDDCEPAEPVESEPLCALPKLPAVPELCDDPRELSLEEAPVSADDEPAPLALLPAWA